MDDKDKIFFEKGSCQTLVAKKGDRIIISGPCDMEISDIRVEPSLDYSLKLTLSMPRENKVFKVTPRGIGGQVEQQTKAKRHPGYN